MALFLNYFRKKHHNHQEDPRLEKIRAFHSIVSILAQIQQGPPFGDNELANGNPPSPAERSRLKLSNAFAHLAVSSTEVVAATVYTPEELTVMTWILDQDAGDDEPGAQDTQTKSELKSKFQLFLDRFGWLFTFNTPNDAMRPASKYQGPSIVKATPPADYPEGDSKETLLQYLDDFPTKKWEAPNEVSHLWLLTKVLTTLKGDPSLLVYVMKYVITVSHQKIIRRFETDSSQDYWASFDSVKSDDILFSAAPKRKFRQTEVRNDLNFLAALQGGVIDYAEKFPNIAKIVKELPDLERSGTSFEIFNDTTCEEYHFLFIDLVKQYKAFVNEIATMAKNGEPFGDKLGPVVETGYAILTMVEGRAFYLYLPTIASKLSKSLSEYIRIRAERRVGGGHGAKERGAEEQDAEEQDAEEQDAEEQDVKAGMTLWDPVEADTATTATWKSFKSWIMLMLVQFDAADALCTFVDLVPDFSSADVEVKIVYSPVLSDKTIPLEVLLTKKYIPEAASNNSPTNAKLLDFIKAAYTVKRQAKFIKSFTESWGPKHVPDAIKFLKEVLEEVENPEHDSEAEDGDDEANQKLTIAGLSDQIIQLVSQPAQDVNATNIIQGKFWALGELLNLQERQDRYDLKFVDKPTFTGALHCEAGLASILDKTTREHIQARIDTKKQPDGTWKALTDSEERLYRTLSQLLEETKEFTRVIGVSKRCCPVCRRFLALLSLNGNPSMSGFVTPGFHNTITRCTLPEWTPEVWVDAMNATFGNILRKELVKLSEKAGSLKSYRSRRQSSGSGISVASETTTERRRLVIPKAQA